MRIRRQLLNLLSASLFVAGTALAAAPKPPAQVNPGFSGLTLCQVTAKAEMCCTGHVLGLGVEPALIRLDAAFQCETRDGLEPAVPITVESTAVKVDQGVLTFDHLCTTALTPAQCPETQGVTFTRVVQVTVEQPSWTVVLQGTGEVFPDDVVTATSKDARE